MGSKRFSSGIAGPKMAGAGGGGVRFGSKKSDPGSESLRGGEGVIAT